MIGVVFVNCRHAAKLGFGGGSIENDGCAIAGLGLPRGPAARSSDTESSDG